MVITKNSRLRLHSEVSNVQNGSFISVFSFTFTFIIATTFTRAKPTFTTAVSTLPQTGMRVHIVQICMMLKRKKTCQLAVGHEGDENDTGVGGGRFRDRLGL